MKTTLLMTLALGIGAVSLAADPAAKDDVLRAASRLADQPNYSWKTTVVVPEGTPFRPGPTEGKTEKNGATHVSFTFGDNTTQAVIHGDKAALTTQDGEWRPVAEVENEEGPGRFRARMIRGLQTPSEQARDLAGHAKDLQKQADVYSSALTEDGAKAFMRFGRRSAAADGPTIKFATGSVKFWLKDGQLQKYEYQVDGTMEFNGNDVDILRTTTVEIKDVGTTKVEVPEAAKKKL